VINLDSDKMNEAISILKKNNRMLIEIYLEINKIKNELNELKEAISKR